MLVEFKGENEKVAYGWEGVTSYEIIPFGWKDFWWYDKSLDVIEGTGIDEFKKRLFRNLEEDGVDTNDIENTKEVLLNRITEDLLTGGNVRCISAPRHILKSILLEKEFELSLVKLMFDEHGDTREELWLFVAEGDGLRISDNNGKALLVWKG